MIELRAATPDDASAIAAIYAPYVATNAVSFETSAPNARQMRTRIENGNHLFPWIVAAEGDELGLPVQAALRR